MALQIQLEAVEVAEVVVVVGHLVDQEVAVVEVVLHRCWVEVVVAVLGSSHRGSKLSRQSLEGQVCSWEEKVLSILHCHHCKKCEKKSMQLNNVCLCY